MRFSEFDVDAASGELRRNGERVRIQDLPLRVLVALLNRAGEVVTRDQLRAELWGAETFVDAEAGLNTAIAKLREALGDSAEEPTYIETLPKRGYRFIGAVASRLAPAGAVEGTPSAPARPRRFVWVSVASAILVIALAALGSWRWSSASRQTTIAVVLFHNETGDPDLDRLAQRLTDATVVALVANPRHSVIGNAAILRTPRIFADIQKIGNALKADYLVLGQVQTAAGDVVVRAHLIRVSDQKHLWAKAISGAPSALESLVPTTVASAVDAALLGAPR